MRAKAQSQIITTILLILIVLAAVIVVWVIIDRIINIPTADCTEIRMSIEKVDTTNRIVSVKRQPGGSNIDVYGAKVAIGEEVKTIVGLDELQTKDTDAFTAMPAGSTIEVAPIILNSEGVQYTCQVTASREI